MNEQQQIFKQDSFVMWKTRNLKKAVHCAQNIAQSESWYPSDWMQKFN